MRKLPHLEPAHSNSDPVDNNRLAIDIDIDIDISIETLPDT
jgi:hypothetical protein